MGRDAPDDHPPKPDAARRRLLGALARQALPGPARRPAAARPPGPGAAVGRGRRTPRYRRRTARRARARRGDRSTRHPPRPSPPVFLRQRPPDLFPRPAFRDGGSVPGFDYDPAIPDGGAADRDALRGGRCERSSDQGRGPVPQRGAGDRRRASRRGGVAARGRHRAAPASARHAFAPQDAGRACGRRAASGITRAAAHDFGNGPASPGISRRSRVNPTATRFRFWLRPARFRSRAFRQSRCLIHPFKFGFID